MQRWRAEGTVRSIILRGVLVVLLASAGVVSWSYWQDPPFWRRWWNILTHLEPDHMDFRPTAQIGGGPVRELPVAKPDGLTVAPAALREAERYAAEFDSYALLVVHWGVVQTEWYAPGWDRNRLTQSQSMMKTVAALALGAALADGHIKSVDEPVATYLPEWAGDPRGAIRIRDLLQMASGLAQARFTLNPFAQDSAFRFLNSSDRVAVYLRTPAVMPPAREFDYNDLDAALVGLIVQRATGRPWSEWLDEKIWRPMGGQRAEVWLDREGDGLGPGRAADEGPWHGARRARAAGRVDRRDDHAIAGLRGLRLLHVAGTGSRQDPAAAR
jgi:CubicO group peptidase (beta-lactamase class C family)